MEDITVSKLYKEARQVASQMAIKDDDIRMLGLDPGDPAQYLRGVGDHLFITHKGKKPLKAPTWKKLKPWWVGRWYARSTDFLATVFQQPQ